MTARTLRNRQEAGRLLAERLGGLPLRDPLVLAIPRGGIEVGDAIAREIGAELDVVLSRKLRSPMQPELALGAVSETGEVFLSRHAAALTEQGNGRVEAERRRQIAEIERRKRIFRAVRPPAAIKGRSVIVTDDGVATGSTMIAALHTVRAAGPREVIAAIPVAPAGWTERIASLCDRIVCLEEPADFWAVGQFYRDFEQVPDERVAEVLAAHWKARAGAQAGGASAIGSSR